MREPVSRAELDALCRALVDQGKLIAAGFASLRFTVMAADAPPIQVEEMRLAFFAGAQHLFGSIFSILEPGSEPSPNDLKRMTQIDAELTEFVEQFKPRAID